VAAARPARKPVAPSRARLGRKQRMVTIGSTMKRTMTTKWIGGISLAAVAALAVANGKPLLLDFYADWCVSCKEMERYTFADPRIAADLPDFRLLRVDVTANNDRDKALLARFRLFGPPATIFFDGQGREVQGARVIGFARADPFQRRLHAIVGRGSLDRG
jgi:thiol:disulfide interchange protein